MINISRAVSLSSVVIVLFLLGIWRFENYSRAVFFIDWLLTLVLISGIRLLFRVLRDTLPGIQRNSGKRVLIVGAGDAGEMLVREMQNNLRLGFQPVGFVDDNRGKVGRRMYGIEVMGTRSDIRRIIVEERIEEVIVAIPSLPDEDLLEFFESCEELGVHCRRTHSLI